MRARTKARKLALDVLYQSEMRSMSPESVASDLEQRTGPVGSYASVLVTGVSKHQTELDGEIAAASKEWSLDRMPAVDRNLLRIALYEMRHQEAVSSAVAISEAVELATELSTAESPKFINGVLGALAKTQGLAISEDEAVEDGSASGGIRTHTL